MAAQGGLPPGQNPAYRPSLGALVAGHEDDGRLNHSGCIAALEACQQEFAKLEEACFVFHTELATLL